MWSVYIQAISITKWVYQKEGILALKNKLDKQTSSKIHSNDLVNLAKFLFLKTIFLNLTTKLSNRSVALLLGLSLLLHTPVFIWMDKTETDFLKAQEL